ncbi:hypothetical protein BJ875DRAFT_384360 [Amylocarpus encephaloides]|uniref:Transcription factor domain-containing protein n=1 Tax=Amylocarpus encephaloides TaxID=45428 RepID=A0A9P7YBS5_9HELO|nr:hypothetical protein BJ875DRAFT_384360 [Amylocarpus encephaloides]
MHDFDIIVPKGPTITVHKGWDVPGQRKTTKPSPTEAQVKTIPVEDAHHPRSADKVKSVPKARQFEFVNTINPGGRKDPEVRKRVRTHVRNEYIRIATEQRTKQILTKGGKRKEPVLTARSKPASVVEGQHFLANEPSYLTSSIIIFQSLGQPTALTTFEYPSPIGAGDHALLSHYLCHAPKRLYPLEGCLKSNPLRSPIWFQTAMKDEAMLHGVLYAGALYLALMQGKRETKDSLYHFSRVVHIVNQRLSNSKEVEDATIGAVTCLGLGEALVGRHAFWKTHMLGIREMVGLRRPNKPLSPMIQAKIRRADVTGAIDYAATPILAFERSTRDPTWFLLLPTHREDTTEDAETFLRCCGIHEGLLPPTSSLILFSQTVHFASSTRHALDPSTFSEDLYWLEYQLLSFPSNLSEFHEETPLEKATRIGSLLYLKAILQEFPHSSTGPSILLSQLEESLFQIPVGNFPDPLVLWLALVGGAFSVGKGYLRRSFVTYLGILKDVMALGSFHEEDVELCKLLGLRSVFGKAFETLWDEVMSLDAVSFQPQFAVEADFINLSCTP